MDIRLPPHKSLDWCHLHTVQKQKKCESKWSRERKRKRDKIMMIKVNKNAKNEFNASIHAHISFYFRRHLLIWTLIEDMNDFLSSHRPKRNILFASNCLWLCQRMHYHSTYKLKFVRSQQFSVLFSKFLLRSTYATTINNDNIKETKQENRLYQWNFGFHFIRTGFANGVHFFACALFFTVSTKFTWTKCDFVMALFYFILRLLDYYSLFFSCGQTWFLCQKHMVNDWTQ